MSSWGWTQVKPEFDELKLQHSSASRPRFCEAPLKRVYAVFGLEDSGSRLVARLVAHVAGVAPLGSSSLESTVRNAETEVQHWSLPFGSACSSRLAPVRHDLRTCSATSPKAGRMVFPTRFFINITQHVRAHAARGAQTIAVLVVRDGDIGLIAKATKRRGSAAHCTCQRCAQAENELGNSLIAHAIEHLKPSQFVIVSYETLMSLGRAYMVWVYTQLGYPVGSYEMPTLRTPLKIKHRAHSHTAQHTALASMPPTETPTQWHASPTPSRAAYRLLTGCCFSYADVQGCATATLRTSNTNRGINSHSRTP